MISKKMFKRNITRNKQVRTVFVLVCLHSNLFLDLLSKNVNAQPGEPQFENTRRGLVITQYIYIYISKGCHWGHSILEGGGK